MLLPCNFLTSNVNVSWVHIAVMELVQLTSEGRIKFLNHRYGRVKAFPNQCSEGNYSIRIDELQNSDVGCYHCKQGHNCLQVELVAEIGKKISNWKFKGSTEQYWEVACADTCSLFLSMVWQPRGRNTWERTSESARASCEIHFVKPQLVLQIHRAKFIRCWFTSVSA